MKSLRIQPYDSRNKTCKDVHSLTKKSTSNSFNEKPTPLDFDSFIPWFCLELQVPKNVVVTRTNQAEYIGYASRLSKDSSRSSKSKSRTTKMKLTSYIQSEIEHKRTSAKISYATSTVDIKDAVPVTTCYDKHSRLVEVAIVGCPFAIPRKVIQAFNLCLPFHCGLFKLTIRKGGLCQIILYEISKLLPHSNITEICLDDTLVPDGNYSVLLDRPSQLKYLSLKRCSINDDGCTKIAAKLGLKGPAMKTLLVLDLTSNNIMDEGAQALGQVLKINRHLLYLNLSGNNITDIGASFILRYLQEFPLTLDDIKETRRRRTNYLISKSIAYNKCLEDIKQARSDGKSRRHFHIANDQMITLKSPQQRPKKTKKYVVPSIILEETAVEDDAEKKAKEIVGEFEDPFAEQFIKRNGDTVYCLGNLTLASLNLAYNNLSLLSVKKILKILKYQHELNELVRNTGLAKVVLDGNNIPNCFELYEIDIYLKESLLKLDRSIGVHK